METKTENGQSSRIAELTRNRTALTPEDRKHLQTLRRAKGRAEAAHAAAQGALGEALWEVCERYDCEPAALNLDTGIITRDATDQLG